ncbi:uncharacterized protein [Littorina saxatilis]|uniref:uncharacterized protein isoform X2 n=1 Tax=Littorina saxatilis TaxID=31220 RepID=UPI0038B5F22F
MVAESRTSTRRPVFKRYSVLEALQEVIYGLPHRRILLWAVMFDVNFGWERADEGKQWMDEASVPRKAMRCWLFVLLTLSCCISRDLAKSCFSRQHKSCHCDVINNPCSKQSDSGVCVQTSPTFDGYYMRHVSFFVAVGKQAADTGSVRMTNTSSVTARNTSLAVSLASSGAVCHYEISLEGHVRVGSALQRLGFAHYFIVRPPHHHSPMTVELTCWCDVTLAVLDVTVTGVHDLSDLCDITQSTHRVLGHDAELLTARYQEKEKQGQRGLLILDVPRGYDVTSVNLGYVTQPMTQPVCTDATIPFENNTQTTIDIPKRAATCQAYFVAVVLSANSQHIGHRFFFMLSGKEAEGRPRAPSCSTPSDQHQQPASALPSPPPAQRVPLPATSVAVSASPTPTLLTNDSTHQRLHPSGSSSILLSWAPLQVIDHVNRHRSRPSSLSLAPSSSTSADVSNHIINKQKHLLNSSPTPSTITSEYVSRAEMNSVKLRSGTPSRKTSATPFLSPGRISSDREGPDPRVQFGKSGFSEGSVSEGSVSEGSVSEGSVSKGSVSEGSVSEGSVSEGSVSEGSVGEGRVSSALIVVPVVMAAVLAAMLAVRQTWRRHSKQHRFAIPAPHQNAHTAAARPTDNASYCMVNMGSPSQQVTLSQDPHSPQHRGSVFDNSAVTPALPLSMCLSPLVLLYCGHDRCHVSRVRRLRHWLHHKLHDDVTVYDIVVPDVTAQEELRARLSRGSDVKVLIILSGRVRDILCDRSDHSAAWQRFILQEIGRYASLYLAVRLLAEPLSSQDVRFFNTCFSVERTYVIGDWQCEELESLIEELSQPDVTSPFSAPSLPPRDVTSAYLSTEFHRLNDTNSEWASCSRTLYEVAT